MTHGYADWLVSQGVAVSVPRRWPLEWLCFRQHPCPHWPGVEMYREMLRHEELPPIVICRKCYCILDGWHRVAASWLEGKRYIRVQFADQHWMHGKECCRVDLTHYIETLRPWSEMDCISASYHQQDWATGEFAAISDELVALGEHMPKMRLWEQTRAVMFLGNVNKKLILDVGTRESTVPHFLANRGAKVTATDLNSAGFRTDIESKVPIVFQAGDATSLDFPDESFDHVICTACVKWMPRADDVRAVKEMARVLKPEGLLAITTDYGQEYASPSVSASGRRIYDQAALYRRLIEPSGLELVEPADFQRSDWEDWPIKVQARTVYDKGVNIQVAFVLLRKG